jgi:hypothetical protein
LKEDEISYFFGIIIIIFYDMLREVDGCLNKCTFSHLITLKNKKDHLVETNIVTNGYTPS